ncbi:hypothetical protein [Corynebacterium glutamicum]|uniref:hypothetical protein n=1 Tax=Corynebacterium glutamicum TaxID=1718 RepID=UPI001B8BA6C9|nr:hypothetical protein [Corynebacterium glutamicum]
MHKQTPETVDLPRRKHSEEPLDIFLQGFFYISLTITIIIALVCLFFEAVNWVTS